MDLIASAILAAVSVGVPGSAAELVQQPISDLYGELKALLKQKYGEDSDLSKAIESLEKKPKSARYKKILEEKVLAARANEHLEILQAAQNLVAALEAQGIFIKVDTGGGAYVEGGVHAGGDFVGRDKIDQSTKTYNIIRVEQSKQLSATAPSPLTNFVGREETREKIKTILAENTPSTVVAILGMGGVGKTELAKQISYDVRDKFAENIFWGDLNESGGDPSGILRTWGTYCGRQFPAKISEKELAEQVRGLLTERRKSNRLVLVVIDDLRQKWLDAGSILRKAVPDSIPILITSREAKVAQALGASEIFLEVFSDSEASHMLISHPGSKLDIAQAKTVAVLCGKMPLALELAAQVARQEGAAYLLDELSNAASRLDALELDDPIRKEESVKITFEISYKSLPEDTALVFRYLGAFAPIFITPGHLAHILPHSRKDNINADKELRRLRRYSLLQNSNDSSDGKSYRIHALLHDYVQTILIGKEATEARQNHFAFFQGFAKNYTGLDPSQQDRDKMHEFEFLYPQMKQALVNFEKGQGLSALKAQNKQLQQMLQLIDTLDQYWMLHSQFANQVEWLQVAYQCADALNDTLKQADFARRLGRVKGQQGNLKEGFKWMKQCETTLGEDQSADANAIRALMYIHRASLGYQKGTLGAAEKDCRRGLEIVTEKEQPRIYAEGYNILGAIKLGTNKLSAAREAFEESLSAWQQVGDQYQIQRVEDNIRSTRYYLGDIAYLRKADQESLQYWEQFPDRIELAMALMNRAVIHYFDEEYESAIALYRRAIQMSDQIEVQRMQVSTRHGLAQSYISLREYERAQALLDEILEIQEKSGIMEYQMDACLAELEIGRKNYTKAIEFAEIALKSAHEEYDTLEESAALRLLAQAYSLDGNLKQAGVCLKKSLSLLHDNEDKYNHYLTLQALAEYHANLGAAKRAQAASVQAQALAKEMGLLHIPKTLSDTN